MIRAGLLLLLAILPACDRQGRETAPPPAATGDWLRPVLEELEARHPGGGLPALEAGTRDELIEVLDAWQASSGRLRATLERELRGRDPAELSAALLAAVEDLAAPVERRRAAYAWLEAVAPPAAVPRLVLRLKYEQDWAANLPLVRTLLRLGNGAGLAALETILRSEEAGREALRASAAEALLLLPAGAGWTPEPGRAMADRFAGDFAQLQRVRAVWDAERRLAAEPAGGEADPANDALEEGLAAATVAMMRRLEGQSLRPVDDARFVLARMRAGVLSLLCEAIRDRRLYVREAVLQVIAWIGPAAGRWERRTAGGCLDTLRQAVGRDTAARSRALQALGALGLPAAAPLALDWLERGDPESVTAAADALLRCAPRDAALLARLAGLLEDGRGLPPEARWSLLLLRGVLDPSAPPPTPPAGLAAGERERRRRWLALRPGD